MSKIEIFEAAGCCATSSVVVSDEAVKWNASAEWAKKNGVDIQRYSLAKNPQQFLNTPVIKEFLNTSGMEGTVAKLAMRQPFVLFKGLTFQKLCLPGAFRPGDHHNKMLRPGLCVVHASPQYL